MYYALIKEPTGKFSTLAVNEGESCDICEKCRNGKRTEMYEHVRLLICKKMPSVIFSGFFGREEFAEYWAEFYNSKIYALLTP